MKIQERNKTIDLLKFIAIISMVIDHLRFVFKDFEVLLVVVGRWAFIIFAFILAFNSISAFKNGKQSTIKGYFKNLLLFSIISEIPYRLLFKNTNDLNIMFTLLVGFSLIFSFEIMRNTLNSFSKNEIEIKSQLLSIVVCILSLLTFVLIGDFLQYGYAGVLLIFLFYVWMLIKDRIINYFFYVAVTLMAIVSSLQYFKPLFSLCGVLNYYTIPVIISIILAMVFIYIAYKFNPMKSFSFFKIGKWAYWFYPIHMILISLIVYMKVVL